MNLAVANAFVKKHHRRNKGRVPICKFTLAVEDEDGVLRGVAIVARPVSRHLDDGRTLEARRICSDGTPNVCSMLYGACRRIAREMGAELLTYTGVEESGASLRAVGAVVESRTRGGSWDRQKRARTASGPLGPKLRWRLT